MKQLKLKMCFVLEFNMIIQYIIIQYMTYNSLKNSPLLFRIESFYFLIFTGKLLHYNITSLQYN